MLKATLSKFSLLEATLFKASLLGAALVASLQEAAFNEGYCDMSFILKAALSVVCYFL